MNFFQAENGYHEDDQNLEKAKLEQGNHALEKVVIVFFLCIMHDIVIF